MPVPIIFFEEYGFALDNGNLPYLAIAAGGTVFFFFYLALLRFVVWPKLQRDVPSEPEEVLVPGMIGVWIIAIGLWIYAWTSRPSVHWIVPVIGIFVRLSAASLRADARSSSPEASSGSSSPRSPTYA